MVKRETSFASQRTPQEIMSKIEEACGPLGFNVRKQNYKVTIMFLKSLLEFEQFSADMDFCF